MIACLMQVACAQDNAHEFGKVTLEELRMRYDKDTTAEAVVLCDIGKSYFLLTDEGFELIFERRTKMKILTVAGLDWAEFSINLYRDKKESERIADLKGITWNYENGQIRQSELSRKNVFVEKGDGTYDSKKFAMPDVKTGSVIEVSYKIITPFFFHFRGWNFQQEIPVIYSEYTTCMNPFYEYTYIFQGATKFDEHKSYVDKTMTHNFGNIDYNDMVYFFVMKDLPAFKDEGFITSVNDYIIKIDFQLSAVHYPSGGTKEVMTTWPKLIKNLLESDYFGKYLKKSTQKSSEITDTMHLDAKTATEKAMAIEKFVKSGFRWNGDYDKYTSESVKDLLVTKTGNSADINLFLAGMLKAAGLEAVPVILSTRGHGRMKADYPFEHWFNYVIVMVTINNARVFVDGTDPLANFSEIPSRCLNMIGLAIREDKTEWVSLKSRTVSSIAYKFDLWFDAALDSLIEKSRVTSAGYQAIEYRNMFEDSYKKMKELFIGRDAKLSDTLNVINLKEIEQPFIVNYTLKTTVEKIEDKILVSPFCGEAISKNPLTMPVRNYPVDFNYRELKSYISTVKIPDGYKILSLPESISIDNDMITIRYTAVSENDKTITISGMYEFKKDLYEKTEYADVKNYFNQIVNKFNENLVLVKSL